jgi:aminopeptidase N
LTVIAADSLLPGGHAPAQIALIQQPLPASPFTWGADPLAFDRYPNYLFAHEVAHQWWGQAVGFKNYHDYWLSEGLAQYSAVMFLGDGKPEIAHALLKQMRESAEAFTTRGPIYLGYRLGHIEGRSAVFRGTVYNKSAVVLHMLRRVIGDEAFRAGLRTFYRTWRFKKAGTDDLRQAFETAAGRPLSRFFDQWVLGSALPRLRVTSEVTEGGAAAVIRVDQIGDAFDVPLTVGIDYADGRSEEVELILRDATTELRVPLKGVMRRIVPRDELTLATFGG